MSKEIESVSTALFDKIRSRFENITLGDESAKAISDPSEARFFNFTYMDEEDGEEFGKVTISLIDEESLKVYYGKSISSEMDREHRLRWYKFLRSIRKFARRNLLTFDTRDINKDNLDIQDIKQQAKTDDVSVSSDVTVTESRLYGTTRNSYADMGGCRILIKHDGLVSDDKKGDRGRRIRDIFIETSRGERFLLPFKNLHGARAIATHLNAGGEVHDAFGQHIAEIVKEMNAMKHFVRSTKKRQFEDQETIDMTQAATARYEQIKKQLAHMSGRKGYEEYSETFVPSAPVSDDADIDALRERFVKKVYDDRFNDALPYVYNAYKAHRSTKIGGMGSEYDDWMAELAEDVYSRPDNDDKIKALQELLKSSIRVGINGIDAQTQIEPVIGDDELDDALYELSQSQGPDADARPLIKNWLQQYMPELLTQLNFGDKNADQVNFAQPVSPKMTNNEFGAGRPTTQVGDTSQMTMEGNDPLSLIRSLAGLTK
jgi:hypothetical protein